jgi:uncharacterized protein
VKLSVKIIPGVKKFKYEKVSDKEIKLWINSRPIENKANTEVLDRLSEIYDKPKSLIRIVSGHQNRNKVIEIAD